MMVYQKLTIMADFAELHKVSEFVEDVLYQLEAYPRAQMVLAIHELCLNIVEHAYAGVAGKIEIEASDDGGRFEMVVRDDGPNAYIDSSSVTPPDPNDYPEGGWGLYILHQVMDTIKYRRLETGNEWHLLKNLE